MKRRRERGSAPLPAAPRTAWLDADGLLGLLVLAALVLTPLAFVPGLVEGFEMPKAGVVRVLGLAAGTLWVGAVASGRRPPLRPLDLAVLAWLLVEWIATAASRAPWISTMGDRAQHEGLLTSTALAGLCFAARSTLAREGQARRALDAFLVGISLASVYAVLQVLHLDPLGWQRTATYGAGAQLRPFATLGHANMLGPITGAGAIVAVLGLGAARGARRIVLAAAAALLAGVTFVTLSRGAWLGAAAGALAALAIAGPRSWIPATPRGRLQLAGAVAAAIVGVALALRAPGWGELLRQRWVEMLSPSTGSSRSRIEIWRTALAMAANRPWIGQGPDTFTMRFPTFQSAEYWRFEWGGLPYHAHSVYLHTLATRGVAGILAGAACAVAAIVTARRALQERPEARSVVAAIAGIGACLAVAGAFGALGLTGAVLLAVGAGTIGAVADPPPSAAGEPAPPEGRWAVPAAGLVAAAVLFGTITELRAERAATLAYLEVLASPADANLPYAAENSAKAVALMPQQDGYAQLHAQCLYGLALRAQGPSTALTSAEQSARLAVRRGPLRPANWQMLALVLGERAARGDSSAVREAGRAWSRHHQLAPRDAAALTQEADLAIRLGRVDAALELSRRAVELYPHDGPMLFRLSGALGWAGDSLGAVATLGRAAAAEWHGDDSGRATAEALLDSVRARSRFR